LKGGVAEGGKGASSLCGSNPKKWKASTEGRKRRYFKGDFRLVLNEQDKTEITAKQWKSDHNQK